MAKSKNSADQQTLNLIEEVKRRRAEIEEIKNPSWKTNCSFPWNERKREDTLVLHQITDIGTLIKIAAFLMSAEENYIKAHCLLGRPDVAPKFTWNGFSLEDWLCDIKFRIDKLNLSAKQDKLDALEARLNAIISPELKTRLELEAITNELN